MLNLVITLVIVLLCFIHKGHACHVHSEAFLLDGDVVIGCQDDRVETSSCGSRERRTPGEESWESGNMFKIEMAKKKSECVEKTCQILRTDYQCMKWTRAHWGTCLHADASVLRVMGRW